MTTRALHWRDWPIGLKSLAAVAVPMALLLFALVFSYRMQQEINNADADLRHALSIQTDIQTLHLLIAEAATGVRGFLLSNREDFLEPYRKTQKALPQALEHLSAKVRDKQVDVHLNRVKSLWQLKQASLEKLRTTGSSMPPAELRAHLIESKKILDDLRREIQAMYARETEVVSAYSMAASAAFTRSLWVDAIISILVLLSGVAAFMLLFSGVVTRVQRLATNAERLSRGEPLDMLPAAKDELGLLAERLQNASVLLAARANEASSASLAKTRFLSRTSHELRTPLNVILGFAQILESDLQNTQQSAAVSQILVAGRHLLSLIDEVLDIARIESGDMRLSLEPQALRELLDEVLDLLKPLASQQKVGLEFVAIPVGIMVLADRQRLRQVLINLVSNAIKYNRLGGKVYIGAVVDGEQVRVMVRDTGQGIRPEDLPRLFSPFERLEAEQTGIEGTGLGLAVSRQLMLCMKGDIDVQSSIGQGSTFSLQLQRAYGRVELEAVGVPLAETPLDSSQVRRRVLVIEDNPSNVALMQALLARRPEWDLLIATDGEAGLSMARQNRPELILLDLHLPGLGGEEVLTQLKKESVGEPCKVIVISADAVPSTQARLRALGAHDYLTKPIDVKRFLNLLDEARA